MTNKKYMKIGIYGCFSALSLLLLSSMAYAHGGYGGWGMVRGMMSGWGMGWWGIIPMLLFWGLIIAGVVFLIKVLAKGGSSKGSGFSDTSRSLEILDERFARGEITQKELEQMKKVIRT